MTMQQIDRAMAAYREIVDTRLAAMDTAIKLLAEGAATHHEDVRQAVVHERLDVDERHAAMREYLVGLISSLGAISEERHAAMREQTTAQTDALSRSVDERFAAQGRAVDTAFVAADKAVMAALAASDKARDAALIASETALRAAFAASEKALEQRAAAAEREFHEHLEQARHETQASFASSDRAIGKAEIAAEKRFQLIDEFRSQLADQAATFMPRIEAIATADRNSERIAALVAQVTGYVTRGEAEAINLRFTERIQDIADRLNKSEGRGLGLNAGWVYILGALAAVGTIVSLYLALKP